MKLKPDKRPFRLTLGERGEMMAWDFLVKSGYRIVEKNFRCAAGEIDVIARKKNRISFVEVKTRRDDALGSPEEAVDKRKQARLAKVAAFYLREQGLEDAAVSFDVVAVYWPEGNRPRMRLIEDAFMTGQEDNYS